MPMSGSIHNGVRDCPHAKTWPHAEDIRGERSTVRTYTEVDLLNRLCTISEMGWLLYNRGFAPIWKWPNQGSIKYIHLEIIMEHSTAVILYICLLYRLSAFAICLTQLFSKDCLLRKDTASWWGVGTFEPLRSKTTTPRTSCTFLNRSCASHWAISTCSIQSKVHSRI